MSRLLLYSFISILLLQGCDPSELTQKDKSSNGILGLLLETKNPKTETTPLK